MIIRPLWSSTRTPWPRPETSLTGFAVDPGVTQGVTRNGSSPSPRFRTTPRPPISKMLLNPSRNGMTPTHRVSLGAEGRLSGEQPSRCARSKLSARDLTRSVCSCSHIETLWNVQRDNRPSKFHHVLRYEHLAGKVLLNFLNMADVIIV
jgi:hypothetical protein